MRQRRVTGIEERLAPYAALILRGEILMPDSAVYYPRWYDRPSPRYVLPEGFDRTYVEIGCGRGRFINTLAAGDPGGLYIGVEGCKTFVLRALEKTKEAGLENSRYIDCFINDATSAFAEESIDGFFLNFSDPWPKTRHADRRLTSPLKAAAYLKVLKPGGFVTVKTDGEAFFEYSLTSFIDVGFRIETEQEGSASWPTGNVLCEDTDLAICTDKTARRGGILPPAISAINTPTEYELKFRAENKQIYCFIAYKR